MSGVATRSIMVYTGIIGCVLFAFSLFQIFFLGIKNIASNEDIRSRWNGSSCNEQSSKIFRDDCSVLDKVKHMFWSDLPYSKLDMYI